LSALNCSPSKRITNPARTRPVRTIRLWLKPFEGNPGLVTIAVGKQQADYFITELPADGGRGILVEKIGLDGQEGHYHVHLDGDKKACECKGHLRHGHCKHAHGLTALLAAGRLL
jgi:hypothetical protein